MLLAGREETWKEDGDSCEEERGQNEERLLVGTELEPGEGEVAELEHLVKRTHAAAAWLWKKEVTLAAVMDWLTAAPYELSVLTLRFSSNLP